MCLNVGIYQERYKFGFMLFTQGLLIPCLSLAYPLLFGVRMKGERKGRKMSGCVYLRHRQVYQRFSGRPQQYTPLHGYRHTRFHRCQYHRGCTRTADAPSDTDIHIGILCHLCHIVGHQQMGTVHGRTAQHSGIVAMVRPRHHRLAQSPQE